MIKKMQWNQLKHWEKRRREGHMAPTEEFDWKNTVHNRRPFVKISFEVLVALEDRNTGEVNWVAPSIGDLLIAGGSLKSLNVGFAHIFR